MYYAEGGVANAGNSLGGEDGPSGNGTMPRNVTLLSGASPSGAAPSEFLSMATSEAAAFSIDATQAISGTTSADETLVIATQLTYTRVGAYLTYPTSQPQNTSILTSLSSKNRIY